MSGMWDVRMKRNEIIVEGKTYVVCCEECKCHDGASFDSIECICPYWCGSYNKNES